MNGKIVLLPLLLAVVTAKPQEFLDFNIPDANPLVVQARPADIAAAIARERQGAAATNVPVSVPAPLGRKYPLRMLRQYKIRSK